MVKDITYEMVISRVNSFISLDISVNSTGWVRKRGDVVETGTYSLKATDELARRIEFENFLENLFGDHQYDRVFVEDVIMGCNFTTTKMLILLNVCVDDLMRYNRVKPAPITRIGNTVWKKYLRLLSKQQVIGQAQKDMIAQTMNDIGFVAEVQDIYDAMGIAVAVIFAEEAKLNETDISKETAKKVKADISKGYVIVECHSYNDMKQRAEKLKGKSRTREIIDVVYDTKYRSVVDQMKSIISTTGNDSAYYCIYAPLNRIGAMCVTKGFDISKDEIFFIAYRKSR